MKFLLFLVAYVVCTLYASLQRVTPFKSLQPGPSTPGITGELAHAAANGLESKGLLPIPAWAITPKQQQVYLELSAKKIKDAELKKSKKFWKSDKRKIQNELDASLSSPDFIKQVRDEARAREIADSNARARKPIPGSKLREPFDTSDLDKAAEQWVLTQNERRALQDNLAGRKLTFAEDEKLVTAFKNEEAAEKEVERLALVVKEAEESNRAFISKLEFDQYLLETAEGKVETLKKDRLALQKQLFGRDLSDSDQMMLIKAFEREKAAHGVMDVARDKYFPGTSAQRLNELELVAMEASDKKEQRRL